MKKRLLSAFLTLSLVTAMFPPGAVAAGTRPRPIGSPQPVQSSGGSSSSGQGVQYQQPDDETYTGTRPRPIGDPSSANSSDKVIRSVSADDTPAQTQTTSSSTADTSPIQTNIPADAVQISDAAGLYAFAQLVKSGKTSTNAVLVNDITLTGSWSPIGSTAQPYTGHFYGGGHIISGLKGYLFDVLGRGGQIDGVLLSGLDGYICMTAYGSVTNCTNNVPPMDNNTSSADTPSAPTPPQNSTGNTGSAAPPQADSPSNSDSAVTPPADSSGNSDSATPPADSSGNSDSATPPADSSGNSGSATPPADSSGNLDSATPPADSSGNSGSATTPPADSSGNSSSATPPADSSGNSGSATTPPADSSDTPNTSAPKPVTTKDVAVKLSTANCKRGDIVTVTVSNATPGSSIYVQGADQSIDMDASGSASFQIDTAKLRVSEANQTFNMKLVCEGKQVGSFSLTVNDPDQAETPPTQITPPQKVPSNQLPADAPSADEPSADEDTAAPPTQPTTNPQPSAPKANGASLTGSTLGNLSDVTYDGSEHKLVPTITLSGTSVPITDWDTNGGTITYSNSNNTPNDLTNVGTITVTVTGDGTNYTGSATGTYKINPANLSNATVTLNKSSAVENGSSQTVSISSVVLDGKTLTSGTDYDSEIPSNMITAGSYTIKVKGKGNYTGEASATFTITKAPATAFDDTTNIMVTGLPLTYNGSNQEPAITVTHGGKNLTKDTDYTVKYTNQKNAGTATVTITGKGAYSGTKETTYEIGKKTLTVQSAEAVDREYDGTTDVKIKNVTLADAVNNEKPVIDCSDLSGKIDSPNRGSYSTVTFEGELALSSAAVNKNYELTQPSGSVTLNPAVTISAAELTIIGAVIHTKTYDGSTDATVDSVAFRNRSGQTVSLTYGVDYEATATFDNANAGTGKKVTVTVTLKNSDGNYTLTENVFYDATGTINPRRLKLISVKIGDKEYDGTTNVTSIENPKFVWASDETKEDTANGQYNISGTFSSPNVGQQTVQVFVTFTSGNYELDSAVPSFTATITKAPASVLSVDTMNEREYDGTTRIEVYSVTLDVIDTDRDYVDVMRPSGKLYGDLPASKVGEYTEVFFKTPLTLKGTNLGDRSGNYDFTPPTEAVPIRHTDGSGNVTEITKATPKLDPPPKASAITFGQTLKESKLDASGTTVTGVKGEDGLPITLTDGKYAWKEPDTKPASAGNHSAIFIYTPSTDNAGNYRAAEQSVLVEVKKAIPKVDSEDIGDTLNLFYGQKLSDLELPVPYNEYDKSEVEGTWSWMGEDGTQNIVSGSKYTIEFKLDKKAEANYENPPQKELVINVKADYPKITFEEPANTAYRIGNPIPVRVTAVNQYDKSDAVHAPPLDPEIAYKIEQKGKEDITGTIPNGDSLPTQDFINGTKITFTAHSTAVENEYLEKSESIEVIVTDKEVVKPEFTAKNSTYDGTENKGFIEESLLFISELTEKPVTPPPLYKCEWRTAEGQIELEKAPVDAGRYQVRIVTDSDTHVGNSEWTDFTIAKRQLTWPPAGWLSAQKDVGSTLEVKVSGQLRPQGVLQDDINDVMFTTPEMVTSGFSKYTEQGTYTVTAKPASGGGWGFSPAVLQNYEWPTGDPEVLGHVGVAQTTSRVDAVVEPKQDKAGHELRLDVTSNTVTITPQLKKISQVNTSTKLIDVLRQTLISHAEREESLSVYSGNVMIYDVKLLVNINGTWEDANPTNFPDGGITVTLPYPTVESKKAEYFTAAHMFASDEFGKKAGEVEYPAVTKSDDGITFKLTGLSPVAIGWTDKKLEKPDTDTDKEDDRKPGESDRSDEDTYRVRVRTARHGRVSVSDRNAEAGETVTITARPNSGYSVESVTVTDSRDREIRVRSRSGNRYSFTMPARAVTVDVVFSDGSSSSSAPNFTQTNTPVWGNAADAYLSCDGYTNCASRAFEDLNSAMWYHIPVDFTIRNSLMGAMGDGNFGPGKPLTRAMLVQILYTHAGWPVTTASSGFGDVPYGAWYEPAVNWAVSQGIVHGMGDGSFSPDLPISREQLSVMLYNYARKRGITSVTAGSGTVNFRDSGSVGAWAREAVSAMQAGGIILGKAGNLFDPKGRATRAETAQMLWNLLK